MDLKIESGTDKDQWDAIVSRSQTGSIIYTWEWMKLVEKHSVLNIFGIKRYAKFYPLLIRDKEKPVGIYPLFLFKLPLITLCYSPPSNIDLLYLGPLLPDITAMKQEKKQVFLQDMQVLVDRFIRNDLKANYIQINTPPGFEDCRFFKWGGYNVEPRYTYYIDLSNGLDEIWKNFNKSLRYYIEKAKKEGIAVTEGTKEDAFFIHDLLKERGRIKSSKEYMGELFDNYFPDNIKVFIAKKGPDRLSGIITIVDRNKVKFWIGSPKCSYKGLSPNELVLWESIRWAAEKGYSTFEIEGADDYSLFPFKRKFNGRVFPIYQMKWLSPSLALISSFYHSLKKEDNCLIEDERIPLPDAKDSAGAVAVPYLTHIRRDVLHFPPRKFILNCLHFFAMNVPVYRLRIVFYRLRGSKIENDVSIAPQVFLEEVHPELITIKERADIGPRVIVLTHDSILFHVDPAIPVARIREVVIGRNCYIGAGAIILPGVTIGDNSIIGAGSVVTKSIPPGSVAMGIPATVVSSRDEWNQKYLVNK